MTQFPVPNLEEVKSGAVLLVDKPLTWTSFDVINKIRKLIHTKIGHAGTLDPLATGLLICCTGKMTKEITGFQKQKKEYTGIIQLGATTPTFDLESTPQDHQEYQHLGQEDLDQVLPQFTGAIQQIPPIHSAVKQGGKPAYKMARKGIEIKLEPRNITIHRFDAELLVGGEVKFCIECSTGTYIRSIANDLGAALGVGGYLKNLRRTKIGNFSVDDALSVEEWVAHFSKLNAAAE